MDYGRLYDEQVASTYDRDDFGLLRGVRALAVAHIISSGLPQDATILDLGAGTGESLVAIRDAFPRGRFIGIDLSERMLAIAREKMPIETYVDDACRADAHVEAGGVDLVLAHFLTSFVDRRRLFEVARRTMRTGGLLSVASTTLQAMARLRAGVAAQLGLEPTIASVAPGVPNADVLVQELTDTGFVVTAIDTYRQHVAFETAGACLEWGMTSGFFTQAVALLGAERVNALVQVPGYFPMQDEYVGLAVRAVAADGR